MAKRTNLYYYTGGDKIFLLLLWRKPPLCNTAAALFILGGKVTVTYLPQNIEVIHLLDGVIND